MIVQIGELLVLAENIRAIEVESRKSDVLTIRVTCSHGVFWGKVGISSEDDDLNAAKKLRKLWMDGLKKND